MPQLTNNIFDDLLEAIQGDVHIDKLRRYMSSTDGSIFKVEPACVVYPKNSQDVINTVGFAAKYGLSIHSRGAGSGLCGSGIGKGIVLDFSKYMNTLISLNIDEKTFECEPGYRFGELNEELKGKGLFFPPDPSSGEYASFGGMYGTNASGAHSVKYGNVSDYVLDAEIVLTDGTLTTMSAVMDTPYEELSENFQKLFDMYEKNKEDIETAYPHVKYNVSGYNLRGLVQDGKLDLRKLFGGSEGTLGIVTKIIFKLLDKPAQDSLVVAFFDDIVSSAKAVQHIMPLGPAGIEIMDKSLLKLAKDNDASLRDKIPDGIDNVLLIEFDNADPQECSDLAAQSQQILKDHQLTDQAYLAISSEEKEKFWAVRKAAVPILYKLRGKKKILALIEDAAVPIDNLVEYFEGVYGLLQKHNVDFVVYGHIAKGLMHTRPLLDLTDPHDVEMLKIIADDFYELIRSLGGVISGEHGDGRLRSAYIKRQYESIYDHFLYTKFMLDGFNILNPEIKTVNDPDQVKRFLRYGKDYRSADTATEKQLVWAEGFENEVEKCHGCSKCTTVTTATRMCPIYKFTRDEAAAPKAKANILRGLMSGAIEEQGIFELSYQHVIDHCVNCGSCHVECPSNVNIPKMAMEARSRYVKKYGANLEKRLLVSAELAGRTTRKFSAAIGAAMKFKAIRKMGEVMTGVTAEREFITFPSKSLLERVERNEGAGEKSVLYFAGCYASYIRPQVGESTVSVLKTLGYKVITPEQHCCGLPMLTKGMADQAKDKINDNLKEWGNKIAEVDHIVVSCSSCGLALMKEWAYLIQNEQIEQVKDKIIHVSDLVNQHADQVTFKHSGMKVDYHMPCHLKVQKNANSSIQMLSKVEGVDVQPLNSHCCGMAGSWGISKKNYDLSVEIGSPMIRKLNASDGQIGVTDCPTCTMQMNHLGDKETKHPIEVMAESECQVHSVTETVVEEQ